MGEVGQGLRPWRRPSAYVRSGLRSSGLSLTAMGGFAPLPLSLRLSRVLILRTLLSLGLRGFGGEAPALAFGQGQQAGRAVKWSILDLKYYKKLKENKKKRLIFYKFFKLFIKLRKIIKK